jgi:hypothetical protein
MTGLIRRRRFDRNGVRGRRADVMCRRYREAWFGFDDSHICAAFFCFILEIMQIFANTHQSLE